MTLKPEARALADLAAATVERSLVQRGFRETRMLTHWREVVGEGLGTLTAPVHLRFPRGQTRNGTLTIAAEGPAAVELQHLVPVVLARINGIYGYPAIAAIRIVQAPVERRASRTGRRAALDPEAVQAAAATLGHIEDPDLRQSLARLAASLRRR